jgi:hypothetical protein
MRELARGTHEKMPEFRQLQAIFSSEKSGGGGDQTQLALFLDNCIRLDQTLAAIGLLTHGRVARFGIARDVVRLASQLVLPNGVADADVHRRGSLAIDSQEQM